MALNPAMRLYGVTIYGSQLTVTGKENTRFGNRSPPMKRAIRED